MLAIWSLVPLSFLNPAYTSGSSQFIYPSLKDFEYYHASMWHECNCVVVLTFFTSGSRHEFEQGLEAGDGQGSMVCCSPWGCKESDMTERLNWTELNWISCKYSLHCSEKKLSKAKWRQASPLTKSCQWSSISPRIKPEFLTMTYKAPWDQLCPCLQPHAHFSLTLLYGQLRVSHIFSVPQRGTFLLKVLPTPSSTELSIPASCLGRL